MTANPPTREQQRDVRRALITYGVVSEALATSNDFFLGIAPIFSVIAEQRAGQLFDADQFANDVRAEFGLPLPHDVAHFLAPRLARVNLLSRRQASGGDAVFFWTPPATPSTAADITHLGTHIDDIISLFLDYSREFPSLFVRTYDRDKLEEILFDFIVSRDASLTAAEAALSDANGDIERRFLREDDYLCARFLQYLERAHSDKFLLIGDIANAAILSELIAELGEGRRSDQRNVNVTIYVDAPLMMDLIGLSGRARKDYASSVVNGLKELGAHLTIFDHSVEEIRDNLYAVLSLPSNQRRGPTADALRDREVDEAFVANAMHNVDEVVVATGINIIQKPLVTLSVQQKDYLTNEDDQRIFQLLQGAYSKQKALERDVLSLRIVISRRLGFTSSNFLRSKHLMITRNSYLRQISRQFVEENKGAPTYRVPPAEHISKIAAAIWLELGGTGRLEISRGALVAACSRVVATRPEIIVKLKNTLQRIVPEKADQFETLISQPRIMRMAMDSFLGNERYVTDEGALEAFDRIERELVAKAKKESDLKHRNLKLKFDGDLAEKDNAILEAQQALNEERAGRHGAIDLYCTPVVRRWRRSARFVSYAALAVGVIGTAGSLAAIYVSNSTLWQFVFCFLTLASLVSGYFGIDHTRIIEFFERRLSSVLNERLKKEDLLKSSERLEIAPRGSLETVRITGNSGSQSDRLV